MKLLGVGESQFAGLALAIPVPQNVAMPLVPRRVVDFRDDGLDSPVSPIKDVEKVERTHVVTKLAQLRQEADWPVVRIARLLPDEIADLVSQRMRSVEQVVATQK